MSTTSSNDSRPPAQYEFSAGKPAVSPKAYWALLISVTLIAARLCFVFARSASIYFSQPVDVSPEVFALIKDHPLLVEHLGEFEGFDSVHRFESVYLDGDEFFFFVNGNKQWGMIDCISRTEADGTQRITSAKLQTVGDEWFTLVPKEEPIDACMSSPTEDDSSQDIAPS